MKKHIEDFQRLNIKMNDILEDHRIDVFIETLKDNIQHEVHLWEPDSLEKTVKIGNQGKTSCGSSYSWLIIFLLDSSC